MLYRLSFAVSPRRREAANEETGEILDEQFVWNKAIRAPPPSLLSYCKYVTCGLGEAISFVRSVGSWQLILASADPNLTGAPLKVLDVS